MTTVREVGSLRRAQKRHARLSWLGIALVMVGQVVLGVLLSSTTTHAIPAFARKYQVNCQVCHTGMPRLNPYGERFLENGYQLPGTEDGSHRGKRPLGDLTLDDVGNYVGFRLAGEVVRRFDYHRDSPGPGIDGNPEDRIELAFPEKFILFTAGTLTKNIGFFVELESNLEEGETAAERGILSINNIGLHNLAHVRVGKLDPSAYWSYPTHRQQVGVVGADVVNNGAFKPPTINRIPLLPNAFAAKFFGLFQRDGTAILPFQPSLFNSPAEVGVDVHGRPFGDWFLYQVGLLNGANERLGDSNNPKDWYVMARTDYAQSDLFSASVSGFAYFGSNNAKVALNQADVNWNRYGLAANIRYRMVDFYGAYVIDRIMNVPQALATTFDTTATGLTVGADILATDRLLLSVRYDNLDAGGMVPARTSNSMLGFQLKYYFRSNIAFSLRDDFNLRKAEGGTRAPRNFRNAVLVGIDIAY